MNPLTVLIHENERLRRQHDRDILALARARARPAQAEGEQPPADEPDDELLDARSLDRESLNALLDTIGIDRDRSQPVGEPVTQPVDSRVTARARARAEAGRQAREKQLEPGKLADGRTASAEAVRARLGELGITGPAVDGLLEPTRTAQPEPAASASERARRTAREEAKRRLLAKLQVAQAKNVAIDARALPADEAEALAELRGLHLLAEGTTAAGGSPLPGARYA